MLDAVTQFVKNAAREELLPRFADIKRSFKSDGSVVTEADLAVQNRLTKELTAFAPAYRVLGEEMTEADYQKKWKKIYNLDGGDTAWTNTPP